jgi:hypothetical protein
MAVKQAAKKAPAKKTAKKAPAKKRTVKKSLPPPPAKKTVRKVSPAKKPAAKKAASKPKETTMTPPLHDSDKKAPKGLEIGDGVFVAVDPRGNGGSDYAAGVVTKAGEESVNVQVFVDGEQNLWLTNVTVAKKAPKDKEKSDDETESEYKTRLRVCWPV